MLIARQRIIAWILVAIGLVPVSAAADTPTEQIQHTIQEVMQVVNDSANSDQQRKTLLRETLMPRFDWPEMAKQALGRHWQSASGREREFVSAFSEFLGDAYVGQIAAYRDEKVQFVQESIDDNRARVRTKILSEKNGATAVDYQLHRLGGEWKIYDVVVDDISIVINYRSQFGRILAKGSFDDLLAHLRDKQMKTRN